MKQADFDDLFSAPAEAKKETGPIRPIGPIASEKARKPESITQLTRRLRLLIEGSFSAVWVEGEISNLRAHPSGHVYFTLKDAQAQIPAVMFRGASQRLPFRPADGLKVMPSRGRASLMFIPYYFWLVVGQGGGWGRRWRWDAERLHRFGSSAGLTPSTVTRHARHVMQTHAILDLH